MFSEKPPNLVTIGWALKSFPSSQIQITAILLVLTVTWFFEMNLSRVVSVSARSKLWVSRRRHDVCHLWKLSDVQIEVSAMGRSLIQGSPTEFIYVSLSVVSCNTLPLPLQRKRRNVKRKKEGKQERK